MHTESLASRFASSSWSSSPSRGGSLFAGMFGLTAKLVPAMAQSRPSLTALAVVTAAVAGLTFAAAPARAEGEGNGDPFALHVPGEAFSVGRTPQTQAGMDAGARTFRPFPATREVQAAPTPQTAVGPSRCRPGPKREGAFTTPDAPLRCAGQAGQRR